MKPLPYREVKRKLETAGFTDETASHGVKMATEENEPVALEWIGRSGHDI